MATAPVLGSDTLSVIADQLANRLTEAGLQALNAGKPMEIGESFPIWMIGMTSTVNPEIALRAATPTGYWHHQIRHAGQATEFAKSRPLGPGPRDWMVEEIVTSRIAERVDSAITVLDREVPGDEQIRLLVFPAYFLHAFWIGSGPDSRLLLIDRPEYITDLEYGQVYGFNDFVQRLSRHPHIIGAPPEAPPQ
jgi:hypothetical protein